MKNKFFSWILTIVICLVLIPIGCFFYMINFLWNMIDKAIKMIGKIFKD